MIAESFLEPKDVLDSVKRQYIGNILSRKNISFINISAIYRDWLHSLGTRSAGKFLKVASTSEYVCVLLMCAQHCQGVLVLAFSQCTVFTQNSCSLGKLKTLSCQIQSSHIAILSDIDGKLFNGLVCCKLSFKGLLLILRLFSKYLDLSSCLAFE